MRAMFLDVQRPIGTRLLDPSSTSNLGQGAISRSQSLAKPMREFTIRSWDTLLLEQAENIRNELHAARITGVYWLYIDTYNEATTPIFIGQGNGSQTQFPAPYNDVRRDSWILYVNGTINTGWTVNGDVFVFSSAPTGRITGIGKRKFRVMLADETESLVSESQLYKGDDGSVYNIEPIVLKEVEGVSIS